MVEVSHQDSLSEAQWRRREIALTRWSHARLRKENGKTSRAHHNSSLEEAKDIHLSKRVKGIRTQWYKSDKMGSEVHCGLAGAVDMKLNAKMNFSTATGICHAENWLTKNCNDCSCILINSQKPHTFNA